MINILYLSDIHFGAEPASNVTSTALAQRSNALERLRRRVCSLELEEGWHPDLVVVSGDIAWKGAQADYEKAKIWLNSLLDELGLTTEELILCAGNHDIDRMAAMGMNPPTSAQEADEWLKPENLKNPVRPFKYYINLCRELGVPQLSLGGKRTYLVGVREVEGLRFVVLNSAWYCRGDHDQGNLWIGLPQLEVLAAASQLVDPDKYNEDILTLALVHHPVEWLNFAEQHSYAERPATYRYLSERSHIILSGHVHGRVEHPNIMYAHSTVFTSGATYAGSNYRNNFSILQIDIQARTLVRRAFEYDPGATTWRDIMTTHYSLRDRTNSLPDHHENDFIPTRMVEMLPRLREKYPDYVRDNVLSVKIVQQPDVCFLQVKTQVQRHSRDEHIERMDLGFIIDGLSQDGSQRSMFSLENSAEENANKFVEELAPYSMIMTGIGSMIFTEEGTTTIANAYESS